MFLFWMIIEPSEDFYISFKFLETYLEEENYFFIIFLVGVSSFKLVLFVLLWSS